MGWPPTVAKVVTVPVVVILLTVLSILFAVKRFPFLSNAMATGFLPAFANSEVVPSDAILYMVPGYVPAYSRPFESKARAVAL